MTYHHVADDVAVSGAVVVSCIAFRFVGIDVCGVDDNDHGMYDDVVVVAVVVADVVVGITVCGAVDVVDDEGLGVCIHNVGMRCVADG